MFNRYILVGKFLKFTNQPYGTLGIFLNSCISAAKAHESLKTIDFDDFLILCDALAPQLFFSE